MFGAAAQPADPRGQALAGPQRGHSERIRIAPLAADGCASWGALAASSLLVDAWLAMASDD